MLKIYRITGTPVISADKPIKELKQKWVESLYTGFKLGKLSTPEQYFQVMILLGQFLSDELYRVGKNPINKNVEKEYLILSNSLGCYMDKFMFCAIQSHEGGEKIQSPHGAIRLLENACDRALEFIPEPEKTISEFCEIYGINFV
ncbi:hypothetical protein ACJDU8_09310 [Clostridium sp. WILCCON 0269]|uniref:Uncharacterized protein n=1 Tax=Candidatus Clostridium eludens TaxID=3381663 RepID=A0ABW8SIA9_9CLOT